MMTVTHCTAVLKMTVAQCTAVLRMTDTVHSITEDD
jgi:hypothetical protein